MIYCIQIMEAKDFFVMLKTILFDLDGTLTDPALGITNSVLYALNKHGYPLPERDKLYFFIGPPLWESFAKYCNINEEHAHKMVNTYREYFSTKGIFENKLIKNASSLLKNLKEKGYTIALSTSKPEVFARKILEHFEIANFFDVIVGSNLDGSLTDKAEVIKKTLTLLNITDKKNVAMVGDRMHDMVGAVKCGVTPIGVLCGYGDRKELEESGAAFIVKDLIELEKLLERM